MGKHLLIELIGFKSDADTIECALFAFAKVIEGQVVHHHFYHFPQQGAMTGFLLLKESHISIHTWPEKEYAALDVFMCKDFSTEKLKASLIHWLQPKNIFIRESRRREPYRKTSNRNKNSGE